MIRAMRNAKRQDAEPTNRQKQKSRANLSQISVAVVQSLSHVQPSVTPWMAARQASLSFTIYRNLLKLLPVESVMPSNYLILSCLLLLLPSVFPSISIFSNELALGVKWPKYWSFRFSFSFSFIFLPVNQLFTSGRQNIGGSTSASVIPMNVQG